MTVLDRSIEQKLTSRNFEGDFIIPSYDSFCLSNVPSTINSLFGLETNRPTLPLDYLSHSVALDEVQNIVLIVLDGFGYDMWLRRISDGGFFQAITEGGTVFPITTVFPSTTAAALTSLSTGLTPQEHGLPEWYVYMKELDLIIRTLPFTPIDGRRRDELLDSADPKILLSEDTIHSSLGRNGIHPVAFLPESIATSVYTNLSMNGSEVIAYHGLSDFAVALRRKLSTLRSRTFIYAYWDAIDSSGHAYGPTAEETEAEISSFSYIMKKEFLEKIDKKSAAKTMILVTADHGQIDVSPEDTIYLNRYRKIVSSFDRSRNGRPILPSWSARDIVLYVSKGRVDNVQNELQEILGEKALVLKTREAIEMGLFGINNPSKRFLERAGDILVLPRENNLVWYEHIKGKNFDLKGMHGGLTKSEVLIPFAISGLNSFARF